MRSFLKYPITVKRLTKEAGKDLEAYATVNGTIYGVMLGISPEDTMISEGNPATSSVLFCEAQSDVKVSDEITYNGNKYIIRGVKNPQQLFSIAFKRCIVEKMAS